MRIESWDEYFMKIAALTAQRSKDPSSQIGACLVKDKRIISCGYNGLPQGVRDPDPTSCSDLLDYRNERPEKYFWYEHGERNALYSAARLGVSTKGSTMYCACGVPCADCTRGIIQAGVEKVYYLNVDNSEKWKEQAKRSIIMFEEAEVKLICYPDRLGFSVLRNGKEIEL